MKLNEIVQKFEAEISRLNCDYESLGSCDCIVVNLNEYDFDGYEIPEEYKAKMSPIVLADDSYSTIDLNVQQTLENLSKLPDGAGYESFWQAVVDNVD